MKKTTVYRGQKKLKGVEYESKHMLCVCENTPFGAADAVLHAEKCVCNTHDTKDRIPITLYVKEVDFRQPLHTVIDDNSSNNPAVRNLQNRKFEVMHGDSVRRKLKELRR